jgi:hypothetical protein
VKFPEIQFNSDRYYQVSPRQLTARERETIFALLAKPFVGRDALLQQLPAAQVIMESTRSASIVVRVDRSLAPPASTSERVPAEAHGQDSDGMWFELLLHVVDGYMDELEIWRGDGGPIMILPEPSTLDITVSGGVP